ncbi:hypothetical protein [Caldifermentibacillus hisashii]|uniref:hypothetical protein n=1 Tax=Caldifermentibacillus hisashii TaxID=996558 RepID=UPI003100AEED
MNRYLKLVNFEFNRFFKLYIVLVFVTIIMQIFAVILESRRYVQEAKNVIYGEMMSKADFIKNYEPFTMARVVQSNWFYWPIALCIVVLLIYVFFIWYRDWLGKNSFIYRLLMLPTARLNLYFAKAAAILIFVFGLVALQLLLFPIETQIMKWIVPAEFRVDLPMKEYTNFNYLSAILPGSIMDFFIFYGMGIVAVFVTFTAILFERCYRLKGIIFGGFYGLVSVGFFLTPLLIDYFLLKNYFFPVELFVMEVIAGIIVLIGAVWIGNYLLKYKIRV